MVDDRWRLDEKDVIRAYLRYLLQTRFLDRLLGDLFDRLREIGLWDRALIVMVSDHGVSFCPGQPRREVTFDNFPDLIPVPLWIKAPGQRAGRTVTRPVSTLDILPTVLELTGVEPPRPLDGVSLFGPERPSAPRRFFVGEDVYDIPEDLPSLLDSAGLPPVQHVLASEPWPSVGDGGGEE